MSDKEDRKFLPRLRLPYRRLPSGPVEWPMLDVVLSTTNSKLPQPVMALADSGAQGNVMHPEVARTLGFELKKKDIKLLGQGVGGNYKGWTLDEPVGVEIKGITFNFEFSVPDYEGLIWPLILGHGGVFRVAKIVLKTYKKEMDIFLRRDIN